MNPFVGRGTGARGVLFGALMAALGLGFWLPACSAQDGRMAKSDPGKVLATVNGKKITEGDVRAANAQDFQALERQYQQNQHDLLESKVKQMVEDSLLDSEAKAKGVSKEKLLADGTKGAPITDADIDKFYNEHKAQIPPTMTKESVAPRIKQYLEGQQQTEARQKFFDSLEAKYKVDYSMEPIRVAVESAGFPAQGPTTAPVTIVEFSDFQCPFCSRLKPELEQVKAKYGDKVRIVFRQFPLAMHENAQKAAEAALCANDQGKFWQMHDAMFNDQAGLTPDALKAKAKTIGLNAQTFNACLDSDKHTKEIQADMAAGQAAGVQGTPAMFVNGRFINGAVPVEQITHVIDEELKHPGQGKSASSK
jgi:protein-disulfide isomerase